MGKPHLIYLAIGFPPAAKSSTYRLRETANTFCRLGWDVTTVNLSEDAWRLDSGVDLSLLERVDPRISRVELPLIRKDLVTDIRTYSKTRAMDPVSWSKQYAKASMKAFPEPHFGRWKNTIIKAVETIHAEHPADLILVSCVPYVLQAVAHHMHIEHRVPYAIDYRDGWSIDVIRGREAFPPDSRQGRLESLYVAEAISMWVVNEPIAEHFRRRYPQHAGKIHVVRNGFDRDSQPPEPAAKDPNRQLVFGYLGTVNFPDDDLAKVLAAWRSARSRHPRLADARLEFRGHFGVGSRRGATGTAALLLEAAHDGVSMGGAVAKGDLADLYARWDALLFILIGGRYMTSGKVYEYMSTGLPIVSAHAVVHDANAVLTGYPLWTGARGFDEEALAEALCMAADMAVTASPEEYRAARAHAEPYERRSLLEPAVGRLIGQRS